MKKINWRKYKKEIFVGSTVVLGAVFVVGVVLLRNVVGSWVPEPDKDIREGTAKYVYFSHLNGVQVTSKVGEVPKVLAMMIDNHPDARPQSGIADASVVYEAPAEGGITRYMAIFTKDQQVSLAGPVRSARPYFMDWAREYGNPPYMHVGGSPEALAKIKQLGMWDADQFFWSQYYWRSTNRFAPHNVYTKSDNWEKLFDDYGAKHPEKKWDGWKFENNVDTTISPSSTLVSGITIRYNSGYVVEWRFNQSTQVYERFVNGSPYKTLDGKLVVANTIAVQTVASRVLDDEGRKEIVTAGQQGQSRVLKYGRLFAGNWKKGVGDARTRFYDAQGTELPFAPGTIWVQVVPNDVQIEVRN